MPDPCQTALDDLVARCVAARAPGVFQAPFDPDSPSPAELNGTAKSGLVNWRPVRQDTPVNFAGLENALELPIHADIKTYYGSWWADGFATSSTEGPVQLIQLWNEDDFDRLIANLIGHALAKQGSGDPFTVFFATTADDSELFLSIDNESGRVMLEEPGKPPLRVVDDTLAAFLSRLTPADIAGKSSDE